MNTRRANVEVKYNGTNVSAKMAPYDTEFTYTDPASGEADSVDISIHDRNRRWTGAWLPADGDTITATIKTQNWNAKGAGSLPCGHFILDDFDFSGWPISGNLSGVSVPADSGFRETQRTKNWENVTVEEIGKEIAARAGISLLWDVEGEAFTIKNVEQSEQTDCDFYMELCNAYGLAMKVYAQKIVVYDREAYKKKPVVDTLHPEDLVSWGWKKSLAGTYTGGEFTYTDPITEEEILVSVGEGPRILKQSGKADDKADAERKIRAAVNKANHGATKLSATIMGDTALSASQCVEVEGLGRLSGKFFIDNATHRINGSGGYTTDLEMSLVLPGI